MLLYLFSSIVVFFIVAIGMLIKVFFSSIVEKIEIIKELREENKRLEEEIEELEDE